MRTSLFGLRAPAAMAVSGSLIAIALWVGRGWGAAWPTEIVTVALSIGYAIVGRRDSDLGATIGGRADERQLATEHRAQGVAAEVTLATAFAGFVILTAMGHSAWQFEVIACVGGASYLVGLLIYRERG